MPFADLLSLAGVRRQRDGGVLWSEAGETLVPLDGACSGARLVSLSDRP